MIKFVNKLINRIVDYFKRYRIVAYNNRMYTGYRHVNEEAYTWIGVQLWLNEHADRTRYVYDILDIRKNKLMYDYTGMFSDFDAVKKHIDKVWIDNIDATRQLIFNFKNKWTKIAGDQAASIYFSDLMTIFNVKIEKFDLDNYLIVPKQYQQHVHEP